MKEFCTAFKSLQIRFAIFWLLKISTKASGKILVKMITDVHLPTFYNEVFVQ